MKIIKVTDPILDVASFTKHMPKHRAVVMVYMMKGCPHCDMLKPKWETVKHILKNDNNFEDVMLADIDSQASNMLPLPSVSAFPSIKVMKGDSLKEYDGIREVDPLLSFLRKTVTTPKKTSHRHTHHNYPKHRRSPRSTKKRRRSGRRHSGSRSTKRTRSGRRSTARRSTARRSSGRRSTARRST